MDLELGLNTARIRFIGKYQMELDEQFTKETLELQSKLYNKKISGIEFWEAYKKSLLKSVKKNEETLEDLIKKTDKKMKEQFKTAEKTQEQKPIIDLKVPK